MRRAEIRRKFDEIVAFAQVEKFLDTPVKHYSSGMYVRLAFAVAAHLEPDILVVDEVLAVGDAEFQRKCLGKMEEVSRREGRTILVVSHNMGVVTSLCTKALWIHQGSIHDSGSPEAVVGRYLAQAAPSQDRSIQLDHIPRESWLADDRLRLHYVEWLSSLPLQHGEPASVRLHFETRAPVSGVSLGVVIYQLGRDTRIGLIAMKKPSRDLARPGKYSIDLIIDPLILGPGIYEFDVGCRSGDFTRWILFAIAFAWTWLPVRIRRPQSFTFPGSGWKAFGRGIWRLFQPTSRRVAIAECCAIRLLGFSQSQVICCHTLRAAIKI